jgi:hypothetical protein
LPRTPIPLLRTECAHLLFETVLFVWSVRHSAFGYGQGMNDLLQPFFFAFLVPHCPTLSLDRIIALPDLTCVSEDALRGIEADSFWCIQNA